jgi:hypothetical protein
MHRLRQTPPASASALCFSEYTTLLIEINVARDDVLHSLLAPPISFHVAIPPENSLSLYGQRRGRPFTSLACDGRLGVEKGSSISWFIYSTCYTERV